MKSLTVRQPGEIATPEQVAQYAGKLKQAMEFVKEAEKAFRQKVYDYMEDQNQKKLEAEGVVVTKVAPYKRYQYDPEVVEFALGAEYVKVEKKADNDKIRKDWKSIPSEVYRDLEEGAKITEIPGQIKISYKKK